MRRSFSAFDVYQAMYSPPPPHKFRWAHPVLVSLVVFCGPVALVLAIGAYFAAEAPSAKTEERAREMVADVADLVAAEYWRTGAAPTTLHDVPGVPPEYLSPDAEHIRFLPELEVDYETAQTMELKALVVFVRSPKYTFTVSFRMDSYAGRNEHTHHVRRTQRRQP